MRELVLSLGLTILTSTLLFVYFRNKHNSLNDKVNLVFDTIQEHNDKMQRAAEEEMMRARAFQQSMHEGEIMQENMQENMESNPNTGVEVFNAASEEEENVEPQNLIEVSDDDLDSGSDESSDEEEEEEEEGEEEEEKSLEDTKVIDISSLPKIDYTKLTKAELRKLCDEKEISYAKSSNKAKLVELLIGFESEDNNTINLTE